MSSLFSVHVNWPHLGHTVSFVSKYLSSDTGSPTCMVSRSNTNPSDQRGSGWDIQEMQDVGLRGGSLQVRRSTSPGMGAWEHSSGKTVLWSNQVRYGNFLGKNLCQQLLSIARSSDAYPSYQKTKSDSSTFTPTHTPTPTGGLRGLAGNHCYLLSSWLPFQLRGKNLDSQQRTHR